MNPGCRVMALFLVLLALFQALPVAIDAWQTRQWPDSVTEWIRLALGGVVAVPALLQHPRLSPLRRRGDTRLTRLGGHER